MSTKSTLLRAAHSLSQSNPEFRKALAAELKKTAALDAKDFNRHVTAHLFNDKDFVKRTGEWLKSYLKQHKAFILHEDFDMTVKELLASAEPQTDKIQKALARLLKDHQGEGED